ncbi:hypothetical protein [Porphyrobacter sp. AAP60]|uniref:hypothetical protein n=1 Tax=Porphyrobacter sp. AAP60 TaxID=1523423 RepID=UPI000A3E02DA|nr:hypothetical protein [Porphyrobacter sp. AAP60]
MRLASVALVGLVLSTTPAFASPADSARTSEAKCVSSLEKAKGASGYKVVRECPKAKVVNQSGAVAMARQPVEGESSLSSDGTSVILSLFAAAAIFGGIYVAVDSADGNPASP